MVRLIQIKIKMATITEKQRVMKKINSRKSSTMEMIRRMVKQIMVMETIMI
jgi:hypothetical protein